VITGHVLTGDPKHWPKLPPIGRLLPNVEGYILDIDKNLTPLGCVGELHIGEFSSSAGYLNLPKLTLTSFATSERVSGKRLYNTGDLVRFCENGELEYFGRRDKQIKIRGFRVELGEIEAKLEACINVNSAVVITSQANNGDISLLAYVVLDEPIKSTSILLKQIKQNIQLELPTFMIPNRIITLPHFPLTSNGKIDKAALPLPNEFEIEQTVNTDRELLPEELKLADIWCEVLNINQISPINEFFELGGHSLLATKLLSRVEDVFGISLGLSTLFETPSLEKMAEKILFESAKEETSLMEMLLNDIENLSTEEISEQLEGAFLPTTDLTIKE
jgi:acyl carrier protein